MSAFLDLLGQQPVDVLVPGDPAVTARAAALLRPPADRWDDAGADLAALRPEWEGLGGDSFRNRQRLTADGWRSAAECLRTARRALLGFSDVLAAAQSTAGHAAAQFEAGMVAAANAAAETFEAATRAVGVPQVPFVVPPRALLAAMPAGRELRDEAVSMLEAARESVRSAGAAAAGQLDEAGVLPWGGVGLGMPEDADADPTGMGDHHPLDGPVGLDDDDLGLDNLFQGGIGDCWFLAGAGAVAAADPDWIREHIQPQPDGSYQVTFYEERDGELVPVTVTVDASAIDNGVRGADGEPSWASIYEKAAAVHFGGDYDDISGGHSQDALELVTGQRSETHDDVDLSDIRDGLRDGRIYTVSTENGDTFNPFDDEVDDDRIVPNHAYVIDQVADHDGDGELEVHVVNPWGPDGGQLDGEFRHGDLWLTEQQFHESFDHTSSVPGRRP
ncbi:C2 family cysteine protease [Nocardioides ferulae]|uniref:C2 family cysteine protease n=1 Tax=Nocardioides ferulae TaxID=2340821 RepID=UPI000EB23386|nr:C2 family cysteine protease [Nocardioides ferulae]